MSLTKCKSCKYKVSSEAKVCPNCGQPDPQSNFLFTIAFCVAALFCVSWLLNYNESAEEYAEDNPFAVDDNYELSKSNPFYGNGNPLYDNKKSAIGISFMVNEEILYTEENPSNSNTYPVAIKIREISVESCLYNKLNVGDHIVSVDSRRIYNNYNLSRVLQSYAPYSSVDIGYSNGSEFNNIKYVKCNLILVNK